jgi:hypothetical protein
MKTDGDLSMFLRRVEKLERAVFGNDKEKIIKPDFKGATGGLRLLLSKGFFDQRRLFSEIETELQNKGYHYSKQAIQTPLNRLSTSNGSLVALRIKGKKLYAKRK